MTTFQKKLGRLGLNAYEIAEEIKVTPTAVYWWMSGKRIPDLVRAEKLESAFPGWGLREAVVAAKLYGI